MSTPKGQFQSQKIDTKAKIVADPFHITKNQGHLQPLAAKRKVKSIIVSTKAKTADQIRKD